MVGTGREAEARAGLLQELSGEVAPGAQAGTDGFRKSVIPGKAGGGIPDPIP